MSRLRPVIVSTSLFRAHVAVEAARAIPTLRGIRKALEFGIPVALVDGGSDPSFIQTAAAIGATIVSQTGRTLGSARRQAIATGLGLGADLLIYTEVEKDSFIESVPRLLTAHKNEDSIFVVPARESMESYPAYQSNSEIRVNRFFRMLTDESLDITFGPRVWSSRYSNYFLSYSGEYGDTWDSMFIPVLRAIADGIRVSEFRVPYVNPPEQSAAEHDNEAMVRKRRVQRETLTNAMESEWNRLTTPRIYLNQWRKAS